jgi:hypothetical protein
MKDNLGKAVSLVWKSCEAVEGFYNDPITIASGMGSEMGGAVHNREREKLVAALAEIGWTLQEVDEALDLRVDPKWAYFRSGVGMFWNGEE